MIPISPIRLNQPVNQPHAGAAELRRPVVEAAGGRIGRRDLGHRQRDERREQADDEPAPLDGDRAAPLEREVVRRQATREDRDDRERDREVAKRAHRPEELLRVAEPVEDLLVLRGLDTRASVLLSSHEPPSFRALPGPAINPYSRCVRVKVRGFQGGLPRCSALDELRGEVEAGAIDTVVVAFTDMQGRLMGKRVRRASSSSRSSRPGTRSRAATTCSRWRWRWIPCPGTRSRLGARLRRLRAQPRPRVAAPDPVARGDGARPLRRRSGTTARRSSRRRGRCCAPRSSGREALGLRADVRLGARVLPLPGELCGGARQALPRPDAVGAVHPRLPRARHLLRRAADPARSGTG